MRSGTLRFYPKRKGGGTPGMGWDGSAGGRRPRRARGIGMTGPVRDDRRRIAIAANPYGGAPSHRRPAEALAAALARRGLEPHVFWERRKRRAALADPDLGRSWRCAVAVGGDGTVADVINEMPPGLPLAVLPAGNENLFARALGSPADPEP